MNLDRYLRRRRDDVNRALNRLLPQERGPAASVERAMRYAVLGGGKRLRPILALAACEACGGSPRDVLDAAAALEMVHAYSLVHDDLPAMDDDDLRRGRPTVHRAFDEGTAILAGDALLTLAFEILATEPPGGENAGRRAEAVALVARRAGVAGMIGGQQADLDAEKAPAGAALVRWIHRHKTGALLSASAELGALHAGAGPEVRRGLARYGEALGLAFQITDDVLDETSTAEVLGKTPGKDLRSGKITYPARYGLDRSRLRARRTAGTAIRHLRVLDSPAPALEALARYAAERAR